MLIHQQKSYPMYYDSTDNVNSLKTLKTHQFFNSVTPRPRPFIRLAVCSAGETMPDIIILPCHVSNKFIFVFCLFEILSDGSSPSDNPIDDITRWQKLTHSFWQLTDPSQIIPFFILKRVGSWII